MHMRLAAAVLLGASVMAAFAAAIRLPNGPGVNLIYAKCQTCHDLQYVVDGKGLLPAQWRAVLASMQDYGMKVSEQEQTQILQYLITYLGSSPPPPPPISSKELARAADGRAVYTENCASCHGAEGRGQPGYFPPLAGNTDLSKDHLFPVLVVLHGLTGLIQVNGRKYNGSMPSFDHLSDAEIAAVTNFVRGTWGNDAAQSRLQTITPETVATQRMRDMTPAEVHAYREGIK